MKTLWPMKIPDEVMSHIHEHGGRGHIKRWELEEAIQDPDLEINRNKNRGTADYIAIGSASNGKRLRMYVKLIDTEGFKSSLISALEDPE